MLIVQGCSYIEDGDGYYRETQPSLLLGQLPGVVMVDCHIHHRFFQRLAGVADVLILFFCHGYDLFTLIERRRKAGKVTVLETNDYYPGLPPWSPIWHSWLDPDVHEEHRAFIRAVDAIQTSTVRLARHWEALAKKSAVFPNQMHDVPPLAPLGKNTPLRLGWAGSQSHVADIASIAVVLEPWLRAHPEVTFSMLSGEELYRLMDLPRERYEYVPPGPIADYYRFLSTLDVGIVPLQQTEYNLCRSDVKFLEYGAHGVAGIYSSPGPYDGTVRQGETGLLYRSHEEFIAALERLCGDQSLREALRTAAHRYVSTERQARAHAHERLDFYRSLRPAQAHDAPVPVDLLRHAKRNGNYFRFELDALSSTVIDIEPRGATDEGVRQLAALLEEDRRNVSLLGTIARMLNDLRRPEEALGHLREALALESDSARLLCESARSHLLAGRHALVRPLLDQALELNPMYLPGWMYLLQYAKVVPQRDRDRLVTKILKTQPQSYRLALGASSLWSGEQGITTLGKILRRFSRQLSKDQLQAAAPYFISEIARAVDKNSPLPSLSLLALAAKAFPSSPKIASLFGEYLRRQGKEKESRAEFERALKLREAHQRYRAEFGPEDMSHRLWRVWAAREE